MKDDRKPFIYYQNINKPAVRSWELCGAGLFVLFVYQILIGFLEHLCGHGKYLRAIVRGEIPLRKVSNFVDAFEGLLTFAITLNTSVGD